MKKFLLTTLFYLVPALAVFSFLVYCRPWLMTVREDSQLWQLGADYLLSRLSEPGGLARYVSEFFVQFCYYVALGGMVMALFFMVMQWLWVMVLDRIWTYYRQSAFPLWLKVLSLLPLVLLWILLLDINVQFTLPVAIAMVMVLALMVPRHGKLTLPTTVFLLLIGWWLAGSAIILLPLMAPWSLAKRQSGRLPWAKAVLRFVLMALLLTATVFLYAPFSKHPTYRLFVGIDYVNINTRVVGTPEEQQYDFLMRHHLWNRIATMAEAHKPKSRACYYAAYLSGWKLWGTGEEKLKACYSDTWGSLSSCAAAFLMSELYLQLGWVNMSQRAAHDALVSFPNNNSSARALKRIAEMNLITGNYNLVKKYTSILEKAPFYRSWAKDVRRMADNPKLIDQNTNCTQLRYIYSQTPDGVFY